MMVPDYVLIAEIILFSEGFLTAVSLSRKVVNLYELIRKQLSQQVNKVELAPPPRTHTHTPPLPPFPVLSSSFSPSLFPFCFSAFLNIHHIDVHLSTQLKFRFFFCLLQDHYDFGLRSIKSMLLLAGQHKRAAQR